MFADNTFTARLARSFLDSNRRHGTLLTWPLLAIVAFIVCAVFFDGPLIEGLGRWPDHERDFFRWLTDFGKSDWILIPALLGVCVAWAARRVNLTYSWRWAAISLQQISAFVFLAVGLSGLATVVLKRIIGRGRPLYLEEKNALHFEPFNIVDWTMHSLPSGHSTTALAFSIVLLTLTGRRWQRLIISFGLAIGFSRIVVGDHFLSDVVAGIVVGVIGALMVRDYFVTQNWGLRQQGRRVHSRMLHGFLPLLRWLRRGHIPRIMK
ncbi:phosphatase PAP2 family protein [Pelagibacterium montanilacus]|uniref:phosphatase PAP2 family protein n=1 Tax=Pelagibacterium montanilacus TaxID=2185280 RepID=UPI000F8CA285|nr:phosphatase PAP2 family protein [Pelagibacterium montanilacus]